MKKPSSLAHHVALAFLSAGLFLAAVPVLHATAGRSADDQQGVEDYMGRFDP